MEGIRLETQLKEIDGTKVLDVTGEIDVYTAPQFRDAVNTVINSGQKHLVVDMTNVTYMDSSGFGALLSATRRLRPQGGTVNLVKVSSAIDRILTITRLNTVFTTYSSVEDALAAARD